MEELIKELAWKCYQNELSMSLFGHGSISIRHFYNDESGELQREDVTEGILKDYERFEKPIAVLERMHKELDEFLEIEQTEDEEFITDRRRGVSSDESEMKRAGHKQSDFI